MKLIIGCGYLGLRVARLWRDAGEAVAALTRSADRATLLAGQGFAPIVADVAHRDSLGKLPPVDTVLYAVGYDRAAGLTHRQVYVGGLENTLRALAASPHGDELRRFVYISTTGVYAASDGWVDEDAACDPNTPGAEAHFEAERVLAASRFADRSIVFRMAGLYGHERIPRREELATGKPIAATTEGYVNLIHVDDAASAVIAAEHCATAPHVFNITDGNPAKRRAYLEEIARLTHAPPPKFVEPDADAPPTRGTASKRISNRRMLAELALSLHYPSYREGLAAAFLQA